MSTCEPMVYLVDDDPGVLKAVTRLLEAEGMAVRAFSSADSFLSAHDPEAPGCAVIDVCMPGVDGLALQQELQHAGAMRAIVFVTGHGDVGQGIRAMKAGAVDFLTKPFDAGDLVEAVRCALAHDRHQRAVRSELQRIRGHLDSLTRRERQVVGHVVLGRLNKQIASDLGIAEKTIKVHRARAMEKMGVGSLAQLVREMVEVESGAVVEDDAVAQRSG